jgi:hypothetical protein
MPGKHNVRSAGMPPKKISSFIPPVKYDLGLLTPSTYIIECKQMYISDRPSRSTQTRMKEHYWHIQPGQPV